MPRLLGTVLFSLQTWSCDGSNLSENHWPWNVGIGPWNVWSWILKKQTCLANCYLYIFRILESVISKTLFFQPFVVRVTPISIFFIFQLEANVRRVWKYSTLWHGCFLPWEIQTLSMEAAIYIDGNCMSHCPYRKAEDFQAVGRVRIVQENLLSCRWIRVFIESAKEKSSQMFLS